MTDLVSVQTGAYVQRGAPRGRARAPEANAPLLTSSLASKPPRPQGSPFGHKPKVGRASQVALVVKNPRANAGDLRDAVSIPGLERPFGGGHGNPLQYSSLERKRSLACYSSWGLKQSDTTEQLTTAQSYFKGT